MWSMIDTTEKVDGIGGSTFIKFLPSLLIIYSVISYRWEPRHWYFGTCIEEGGEHSDHQIELV